MPLKAATKSSEAPQGPLRKSAITQTPIKQNKPPITQPGPSDNSAAIAITRPHDREASDQRTGFWEAVKNGRRGEVQALLGNRSGTIKKRDINGALREASARGYPKIVRLLIGAGADVNGRPEICKTHILLGIGAIAICEGKACNRTALQAAAGGGHTEIVSTLLKARADVNGPPSQNYGRTALQAAVEGGHTEIVSILLKARADVNGPPSQNHGRTALQAAVEGGHTEIVSILLKAQADVNGPPSQDHGRTALQAAAGGGHTEIVSILLKARADVNGPPSQDHGRTALQAAAGGGHTEIVSILLKAQADVNAPPSQDHGRTALQAAAEGGHTEIVSILLKARANVNAPPSRGWGRTALQAAAGGGHTEIVSILLKAGANVNQLPYNYGTRTALQAAASGGHTEIVPILLEAGADVDSNWGGRTALQAAAEGGHAAIVLKPRTAVGAVENLFGLGRSVIVSDVEGSVVRVTGIPLKTTEYDLRNIISSEFSSGLNTGHITICPSCYDKTTQTALVQFETYLPPVLGDRYGAREPYEIQLHDANISISRGFYGLTQLYPTEGQIVADVVAVCGLNGHAYESWVGKSAQQGEQNMWLHHFLREDLPNCRTMIYGYNPKYAASSASKIPNFADKFLEELEKARKSREEKERPIIFIGHSFGGIIIAQAKYRAKYEHTHSSLFSSIRATIFFGIPHHGLVTDDLLAMFEQGLPSKNLVTLIQRELAELGQSLSKFIRCCTTADLKIVSFKETEKTRKMKKGPDGKWSRSGDFFTDAESALPMLQLPGNIKGTVLAGDNSTMVKFAKKDHLSYKSAIKCLQNLVKSLEQTSYNSISVPIEVSANSENELADSCVINSPGPSSDNKLPRKLSPNPLYSSCSPSDRPPLLAEVAETVEPKTESLPLLSRYSSPQMSTSVEQTTRFGDAAEKEIKEKYPSPLSAVEPFGSYSFTTQHTLAVDKDYSWPARFADGKVDINFPIGCRWSLLNEAKGWIEDLVQEQINWWPLGPRRHPLPENCLRVNWKCRCGKRLSDVISRERMSQYNQWFSSHNNPSSSPNHNPTPTPAPMRGGAGTGDSPGSGNISLLPTTNLPRSTPNSPMAPVAAGNLNSVQNTRLMWCVNLGPRLTLVADLEVYSSDGDAVVFRNLRTKYWKIRSWRRWFSLYAISDIKYVKFNRYRLQRVSCYGKEELPLHSNLCYDYNPRPPEEVPPVPAQLLMEYFEDPSCAGTSAEILQTFPKKVDGPLGDKEKYGWGLHACEHLSFFRTITLSLSILVGPAGFFVNWLVHHPGDLQNASVPLFLAFAAIGTFIVLPHYFS